MDALKKSLEMRGGDAGEAKPPKKMAKSASKKPAAAERKRKTS